MILLSLLCISPFTWSATSGASIGDNFKAYTEELPMKSLGGFGSKEFNGIPGSVGKQGRTRRILNGEEALVGEFPWMASIHWNKDGHQCGGSIISRKHILTAAYCLPTNEFSQLTVLVGGHFQDESLEPQAQRIAVKKAIKYSDYNSLPVLKHDIAILVLEKQIELNNYTGIINLPSRGYLYGDINAIALGWGRTYGENPFVLYYKGYPTTDAAPSPADSELHEESPMLKATNLTIFNNTECNLWHVKHVNYQVESHTTCAGASSLTWDVYPGDTTQGDAGGPLVIKENGKWVVVGITSASFSTADHPLPGIFTRVSEYLPWIKVQMNEV